MQWDKVILVAIGVAGGLLIALIIYLTKRSRSFRLVFQAKKIAEEIKESAHKEVENAKKTAVLEAKDEWFKQKKVMEDEIKDRQRESSVFKKKSIMNV
jgi:ribonuclease Y